MEALRLYKKAKNLTNPQRLGRDKLIVAQALNLQINNVRSAHFGEEKLPTKSEFLSL